jgi:hypothetical protein
MIFCFGQTTQWLIFILLTHGSGPYFSCCQDYIKDLDRKFVADTVAAVALCAQKLTSISSTCLEGLLALVFYGTNFQLLICCNKSFVVESNIYFYSCYRIIY